MPFTKQAFETQIKDLTAPSQYFLLKNAFDNKQFLGNTGFLPPHMELKSYFERATSYMKDKEAVTAAEKFFKNLPEKSDSQLASSESESEIKTQSLQIAFEKVAKEDADNYVKKEIKHEVKMENVSRNTLI